MEDNFLLKFLQSGHEVAVRNGRLTVSSVSGNVPLQACLQDEQERILKDLSATSGRLFLAYQSFSVGNYGSKKRGGVTLQFRDLRRGGSYYAIFNVGTKRSRDTRHGRKGEPLPPNRFKVAKGSGFLRFWKATQLPFHRLSDFHDYMGHLKVVIFTANVSKNERLDASTLMPLNICFTDIAQTIGRQVPDSLPTLNPDKRVVPPVEDDGFQRVSAAGDNRCGNTVIRVCGSKVYPLPPSEQSNDEWIQEYESAKSA